MSDEIARPPLFVHVFASFGGGGVPYRIAGFLNWLGTDARHLIIALDGDFKAADTLFDGLDVRLETVEIPGSAFSRLGRIRKLLKAEGPDLLLTYNWGAIEWALANRLRPICPHIHFESGFGKEEATAQLTRRVWARRLALQKSRALVVPSSTLVSIASDQWKIPEGRIRHIRNGVDVARFGGAADPNMLPMLADRDDVQIIGTVTPLRPEKNVARLIDAFASVSAENDAARLVIAGDGNERPALEAHAAALGLADRIVFMGHVAAPEKLYGLFDVFAMSSDTEQMPNVVLQAMAAGLPVAATDVGDIAAMVAAENRRFISEAGDSGALASAIEGLLADQVLRQSIGAANRERAEQVYDLDEMHNTYRDILGELDLCVS